MLDNRADGHIILALVLIAFAVFANSLGNKFVYDDHLLIVSNQALRDWNYLATVFTDSHAYDVSWINVNATVIEYYRPFTRMLFALAFHAFGLEPSYWHLLNVLIYCIVVALAYLTIKRFAGRKSTAALGALLFAVHPIHSESVAWVNCIVETLHAAFFLGAFLLYLHYDVEAEPRKRRLFFIGSLAMLTGALFSKETALCFPILVAAHKFIGAMVLKFGSEETPESASSFNASAFSALFLKPIIPAFKAVAPYLVVIAGYMALRYSAYGGLIRIGSNLPMKTTLLTIPSVVTEYIRMMVWPVGLSVVHSVPLAEKFLNWRFLLPAIPFTAAALLILLRSTKALAFACVWILIALAPALNLGAFAPEMMLQDRYAFLASLGFCAAAAIVMTQLLESERAVRFRLAIIGLFAIAAVSLTVLTVKQNRVWYSDETLFARAAARNPNSDLAACNYASSLFDVGKKDEAAYYYSRSLGLSDFSSGCACMGLGGYYAGKEDYDQAIQFYENAVGLGEGENNLLLYANLAQVYDKKGLNDKAIELLRKVTTAHPNFDQGYYLLGGALLKSGRIDEGMAQLRIALELNPRDVNTRMLLGQACEDRGLIKEAEKHYRSVLDISPNLESARARLSALEK